MKELNGYDSFIKAKSKSLPLCGLAKVPKLSGHLFPFQKEIVAWALRRGRAAIFADTGLGKTRMQLEWARHVVKHTGGKVLVLAPLAQQTVREGAAIGVDVKYAKDASEVGEGITITNYDRLAKFDCSVFAGVVLDECGILKSYMGATKRLIVESFARTPFRLACSATPAPNDHLELGNQAEFLGVLTSHEMIARWFINDTSTMGTYRLRGHAVVPFWDWLSSWARCVSKPSDLGLYSDEGYVLPPLVLSREIVDVDVSIDRGDNLFRSADMSATSVHKEKRLTAAARAARIAELVLAEPDEQWIVWCDTDYEADALTEAIPEAVEVRGSQKLEEKEAWLEWFQGYKCMCNDKSFRAKHTEWQARKTRSTSENTTQPIEPSGLLNLPSMPANTPTSARHTLQPTTPPTSPSTNERQSSRPSTTILGEQCTPPTQSDASKLAPTRRRGRTPTQQSVSTSESSVTESVATITSAFSRSRAEGALFAGASNPVTSVAGDSTSTTAMSRTNSEDSSASTATTASGSSETTLLASSERPCICGHRSGQRVLISKPSIFGYGLNLQSVARVAFVGASFSYEAFYQAIRRCWRFGQTREVKVYVAMSHTETAIWSVLTRKADAHDEMKIEMLAATRRAASKEDNKAVDYEANCVVRLPVWLIEGKAS